MSRTIALRLEDAAASRVVTMWERLYVEWGDQTLLRPDAEPHIILAELPDHPDAAQIEATIGRVVEACNALPVTLLALGVFPGPSPTIVLLPRPTMHLLRFCRALHAALAGQSGDQTFQPHHWQPHVVISAEAISVAEAVRVLLPMLFQPIVGKVVALEVVERATGSLISSHPLRGLSNTGKSA